MGEVTHPAVTGLGTPAARWAMAAIWLLSIAWGAIAGVFAELELVDLLPYATLLIGGYLLCTPGNQPLSPPRAVGVVAAALVADVFVLRALTIVQDSWLLSLAYYLVALLIARGNSIIGGIGAAITLGYGLAWAILAGAAPEAVLDLLAIPVIAIVVGVVWRLVLRRVVERERVHRGDAARAERQTRVAAEAMEANRRELAAIGVRARPLLARIAAGEPLERLRVDLRVTEGAVRDRIRSPGLQHPILIDAIAACRRAGVEVLLLGEQGTENPPERGCVEAISALIADARAGRVTVRILPPGRDAAASVVHQDGDGVRRTMIAADGSVLTRL